MSISDVSAEQLAKLFYRYYAALAPDFNAAGKPSVAAWPDMPAQERSHVTAAVRLALLDLGSTARHEPGDRNRYFPRPGEAEWGA
jgi:hypothetical protein